MTQSPPTPPNFLPIEFIVVGGSLSGLSAAAALARVGHKVTLFEILDPFQPTPIDAGCRLPPNSTKVYYQWGLGERLQKYAIKSEGTLFASYESGSVMAQHEWEEDMMQETGGEFLLIHYSHLRRTVAEYGREHGVQFRSGEDVKVTKVLPDPERPSVTLANGEVVSADVVIGADGYILPGWVTRRELMEATSQEDVPTPTGVAVYNTVIREADVCTSIEDTQFLEQIRQSGKVFTWLGGAQYGAQIYPIKAPLTGEPLIAMYIYASHDFERDEELKKGVYAYLFPPEKLAEVIKDADPRLRQFAKHAERIICVPIFDRPALEEWVHPGGRVICIGDGAHPTWIGSTYVFGVATGDAAVAGRLFQHLHRREQISSFLNAIQEIRQPRVEELLKASVGNVFAVSLPPGIAEAHDRTLRERAEKGIQTIERGRSHTSEEMQHVIERYFGYDPEDEADHWWVRWGVMQERAACWGIMDHPIAHVTQEVKEEKVVVVVEA